MKAAAILDNPAKNLDDPSNPMRQAKLPRLASSAYFADPQFGLRVMRVPNHAPSHNQHAHDFEELVVILAGQGRHQVGPQTYDISAGDVFVVLGDMTHCYPAADKLSLINILYDSASLRLPQADLGALPGYHALFQLEPRFRQRQRFQNRLKLDMAELGRLLPVIAELEGELQIRPAGFRFLALTQFMRIIGFLARAYARLPVDPSFPVTQLGELLSYMEQHYTEQLSIADLARVAHMSQTTLYRAFRHVVGRSPIDYLIRLRIDKAAQLLQRGALRIGEVSAAVGFGDSNYFARQFRAVTGHCPRAYRLSGL